MARHEGQPAVPLDQMPLCRPAAGRLLAPAEPAAPAPDPHGRLRRTRTACRPRTRRPTSREWSRSRSTPAAGWSGSWRSRTRPRLPRRSRSDWDALLEGRRTGRPGGTPARPDSRPDPAGVRGPDGRVGRHLPGPARPGDPRRGGVLPRPAGVLPHHPPGLGRSAARPSDPDQPSNTPASTCSSPPSSVSRLPRSSSSPCATSGEGGRTPGGL